MTNCKVLRLLWSYCPDLIYNKDSGGVVGYCWHTCMWWGRKCWLDHNPVTLILDLDRLWSLYWLGALPQGYPGELRRSAPGFISSLVSCTGSSRFFRSMAWNNETIREQLHLRMATPFLDLRLVIVFVFLSSLYGIITLNERKDSSVFREDQS